MEYFKNQYDKTHIEVELKIGDLVMVYWPVPKKGFIQNTLTYRIEKDAKTIAIHVQRLLRYTSFTPNERAAETNNDWEKSQI
ncbi:hypothetical protein BpHYR1_046783 [Brachionus plicatilis]|uniref:Uncharacterized protein n=1 Tax=Brachionus plicatilis TaxID=10195 RepID=A0A3M7SAA9_BRAPC|nr:hypothetical protein BpHYR1_046783 [Brachionus plicatilis]